MNADSFRFDDEGPSTARRTTASRRVRAWLERHWGMLALIALAVVATGLVAAYVQRPSASAPPVVVYQPTPRATPSPPPMTLIVVHVSGAVASPGIYQLPIGSRIDDAIKLAGGALSDADLNRLNLAARVADGQQVVVPLRQAQASPAPVAGAEPAGAASPSAPRRVNLNTASIPELDGLPGVGPVTAQRIVAYREQHGSFTRIEQLREAKLVNAATFEKLKDHVTIE